MSRLLKITLGILLLADILLTAIAWLVPVEVFQNWAFQRAPNDPYLQFEAIGQAEALCWLGRAAGIVIGLMLVLTMTRLPDLASALNDIGSTLRRLTVSTQPGWPGQFVTIGIRLFLLAWMLLAATQAWAAILQRTRDWPYYHFNPGSVVLPNISDSNRDVIRYLREAVPPTSRVLVLSDQKLFFLSYYLLPRRLLHPMHADSEFVIPLPDQQRQLAAYRLSDLTAEQIRQWRPDYILEYFEGPEYNEAARRGEDANWVRFWRARSQSSELPPYVVVLRPVSEAAR
jgi:hypothetical protein